MLAVSRRTTRRHHLFVPDLGRETEDVFWYCLGIARLKSGVRIHAACLMSNHAHLVITDVEGRAPTFFAWFHRLLALCTKARLGWPAEVFDKAGTSSVELVSTDAIIDSIAYAIANPVTAGLVRRASEWPGARTSAKDMGTRTVLAKRVPHFFRSPRWPESVDVPIDIVGLPDDEMEDDELRRRVQGRVNHYEAEALARAKREKRKFVGVRRVRKVSVNDRASSWEDFGSLNPRFAARGDRAAARDAVARFRAFYGDYNDALARWTGGDRDVKFPHGTWWMRVHHGARVRPPP